MYINEVVVDMNNTWRTDARDVDTRRRSKPSPGGWCGRSEECNLVALW